MATTSEAQRGQPVRVGYISASDPDDLAYDFGGLLPEGLEMLGVAPPRPIRAVTPGALKEAEAGLEAAAEELVGRDVRAIILSIAPLIYVKGVGYDSELCRRLHLSTGLPVTTNQTAAIQALRELRVGSITLLSPNTRDLLERQARFFEASGIDVVHADCLDIPDNRDIDCVEERHSYEFIQVAVEASPKAEGIYLSGPCWRTLNLNDRLESQTGLPVVTALQSTVWAAKRLVSDQRPVLGYGQLLRG
jgi:maleate cis-trans isomerase